MFWVRLPSSESHRLLILRGRSGPVRAWCNGCSAEVRMITPKEAAAIAGTSSRAIYRWTEDPKLHFSEEPGDGLLVCANSLEARHRYWTGPSEPKRWPG